jgi:amino-acid N-acetyltransferase
MDNFTIRAARATEQAVIQSLIRRERLDPLNIHWENFLVVEDGGRIIGIGQVKPYPGGRELGSLVVVPERRRSGIGAAIINALLKNETGPLVLFCLAFREPYYARFGFQRARVRDLPWSFKGKYVVGWLFTRLFERRLIVMARSAQT